MNHEDLEKGRLIKEALKIVDKLAESDLDDVDGEFTADDFDYETLQKLINKSKELKKSHLWNLK